MPLAGGPSDHPAGRVAPGKRRRLGGEGRAGENCVEYAAFRYGVRRRGLWSIGGR